MSKTAETIQLLPELTFKRLELHLDASPTFTRRFGKKVQAAGGHYSHARGDTTTRYVHVPVKEVKLIADLLNEFPRAGWRTKHQVVITRDTVEGLSSSSERCKYLTLGNKEKKTPEGITKLLNKWSAENDEALAEYNRKKKEEQDRVERENKERKEAEEAALDYLKALSKEEILRHLSPGQARAIADQHKANQ